MKTSLPHIAFLHQVFPCSGAEQVTMDVANWLQEKGYRVTIMVAVHQKQAYPDGQQRLFGIYQLPQRNVKRSKEVAQCVRDYVRQERVQVIVTYRELFYAQWLKNQTGVKIVYELHNKPYYECLDIADKRRESRWQNIFYGCGVERLLKFFYRKKYLRIYHWSDAFVLLCKGYQQDVVNELRLPVNNNKTWVLPNPIKPTDKLVKNKQKLIIYVGRLTHRDKRVDRLLRIWKMAQDNLTDWHMEIVGSGEDCSNLQSLALNLKLKRVSFKGRTNRVKDYYDRAAILCLTSSFEGWPMCVAEAQANGVIPIVFDSFAGAADLISTPQEGIRVFPYDEQRFAQELVTLAHDDQRMNLMSKAAIEKVRHYSIERSGKEWERMLNNIIYIQP